MNKRILMSMSISGSMIVVILAAVSLCASRLTNVTQTISKACAASGKTIQNSLLRTNLEQENTALHQHVEQLTTELTNARTHILTITQQLHEALHTLNDQEQHLANYRSIALSNNQELAQLHDDYAHTAHNLEAAHKQIASLGERIYNNQHTPSSTTLSAYNLLLEDADMVPHEKYAQLQQELELVKEQLIEAQEHATILATTLASRGAISVQGLRELHEEQAQLSKKLGLAQQEIEQLNTQNKELQKAYHARANVSVGGFEDLKTALIQSQAVCKRLESERDTRPAITTTDYEKLTYEISQLRLENQLLTLHKPTEKSTETDVCDLKKEHALLTERLNNAMTEAHELHNKIAMLLAQTTKNNGNDGICEPINTSIETHIEVLKQEK